MPHQTVLIAGLCQTELAVLLAARRSIDEIMTRESSKKRTKDIGSAFSDDSEGEPNPMRALLLCETAANPPCLATESLSMARTAAGRALAGRPMSTEHAQALYSILCGPLGDAIDSLSSGIAMEPLVLANKSLKTKVASFCDHGTLESSTHQASSGAPSKEGESGKTSGATGL